MGSRERNNNWMEWVVEGGEDWTSFFPVCDSDFLVFKQIYQANSTEIGINDSVESWVQSFIRQRIHFKFDRSRFATLYHLLE